MRSSRSSQLASTPVPWLSAALLAAALLLSLCVRLEDDAVRELSRDVLSDAQDYFLGHPYLEPPPALAVRLESASIERARRNHEDERLRRGWWVAPPSVMAHQQSELEMRIATAQGEAPDLTARGVAVVPADRISAAWLLHPLLHVSRWQLLGNGLLWLLLGVHLERSLGRVGFAVLAAGATLAGAAAWRTTAPEQAEYGLVGSAPLLAGLLAAFAVRFARRFDEAFYPTVLVAGVLWLALPPWVALGWSFTGVGLGAGAPAPAASLVYPALLGAAAVGALASAVAWWLGSDAEPSVDAASEAMRSPQVRRAMRARAAGRPREAMDLLATLLAAEPDAYEAALALHDVAREAGRGAAARAALLRVVRIELDRALAGAAIDHWLELVAGDGIPDEADPALLIHMALVLREAGRRDEAVQVLRCALERSEDRDGHVIAARIARAARGLDPGVVETAAWRALGFIELELAERQALEDLIAEALESTHRRADDAALGQPFASFDDPETCRSVLLVNGSPSKR